MTDKVLYEVVDGVGVITLNRPEVHNAMDDEAAHLYKVVLDRALEDDAVRASAGAGRRRRRNAKAAANTASASARRSPQGSCGS